MRMRAAPGGPAFLLLLGCVAAAVGGARPGAERKPLMQSRPVGDAMRLEDYDVVWNSPGASARDSMPLGNGDIALNAWAQADGGLLFYIGKADAWGDNSRLLKVGRVRVTMRPNPFAGGARFRQRLHLRGAEMIVTAAAPQDPDDRVEARLWVDANRPIIHVTIEAAKPLTATASFHLWRTEPRALTSLEVSDIYNAHPHPPATVVEPDTVLKGLPDGIGWYHRNVKSVGPELTMRFQDLTEAPWKDPLLHRTFGALIAADGGRRIDDRRLESPKGARHRFSVYVLTRHPATAAQWLGAVRAAAKAAAAVDFEKRRQAHLAWWRAFWDRSHVYIRGDGRDVARGYTLQRFITACAGRGAYPIKFNGSLFVMPWPGKPEDADYRRWGPGYWWQNSRLPYISACAAGDFDLMRPFFDMYGGEVLAVCRYRTKRYFGFDGAYFPECIYPWGAVFMQTYGWDTPAAERKDKLQTSGWHKWEWVAGLELVFMMQDYYEHTLDADFLAERLLPTARAVLAFFDNDYKTGTDGKMVMRPAQALETWWRCTNPMPELAGLHAVTARLLALPDDVLPNEDRRFAEGLRRKLPDLPTREADGVRMLAPAERYEAKNNCENPELYAVFPFRLCAFEKPNAALGVQALRHRLDRGHMGWRQDDIFMACLGLARDAKAGVVSRARAKDPACRFPAFWGPNYDWTPDQDHGGVLMKTVQAMLMQTDGRKIFLLPAWSKAWDADFKLHAPYRTVVEGSVRGGRLNSFTVTPGERRKDVIFRAAQ